MESSVPRPAYAFWLMVGLVTLPANNSTAQYAQTVISGNVSDERDGSPLINAIVFLDGTTIGTNTGPGGEFSLRSSLAGEQTLVVSIVGYERRMVRLHLRFGDSIYLPVSLPPRILQQKEIEVTAEDADVWRSQFDQFRGAILGSGPSARQCRFVNPYVVNLELHGDTLIATSDSLVQVENLAFGYTLQVAIRLFRWNMETDEGVWSVQVFFQECIAGSSVERENWMKNRQKAYAGSPRHFLWALANDRLVYEGFEMRSGRTLENSRRWRAINRSTLGLSRDSMTRMYAWIFREWVRVDDASRTSTPSFVRLLAPSAVFDSSGVVSTERPFEFGGTWSRKRLGSMLPSDFSPGSQP